MVATQIIQSLLEEVDDILIYEDHINNSNPCVRAFGLKGSGIKCKDCIFLYSHKPSMKKYYKCEKRDFTLGPGSDHRLKWDACSKYQPRERIISRGS